MFLVSRKFFSTEVASGKAGAEAALALQKAFAETCANAMKKRGHTRLVFDTVKNKNGKEIKFDFSYGWFTRYYCRCNTSEQIVTKDMIAQFENDLKSVGINPSRGVYFSKAKFDGNTAEIKPLFVEAKSLEKMVKEGGPRIKRNYKVFFFCVLSMSYLLWTFLSDRNPQRRRMIERYHRYIKKDEKKEEEIEESIQQYIATSEVTEEAEEEGEAKEGEEAKEAKEGEVAKEEEVIEETDRAAPEEESWSFFSSVNRTFWWLLGYK